MATTIQTKTRSRVLMRCGLSGGRPRMCRYEPNGDQPYRTNDHDQYAQYNSTCDQRTTHGRASIRLRNFRPNSPAAFSKSMRGIP